MRTTTDAFNRNNFYQAVMQTVFLLLLPLLFCERSLAQPRYTKLDSDSLGHCPEGTVLGEVKCPYVRPQAAYVNTAACQLNDQRKWVANKLGFKTDCTCTACVKKSRKSPCAGSDKCLKTSGKVEHCSYMPKTASYIPEMKKDLQFKEFDSKEECYLALEVACEVSCALEKLSPEQGFLKPCCIPDDAAESGNPGAPGAGEFDTKKPHP